MALVRELGGKRRTDGRQHTREYIITQCTDDNDARDAMFASADCPATVTIGGVVFPRDVNTCGVDENYTHSTDGTTIADGHWIGRATWKNPNGSSGGGFQTAGNFSLSFDITGQSTRIMHSRQTVNSYPAPGWIMPNFKQAMNVQSDGTIEGTDIVVPYFSYTLTKTFSDDTIANGWVLTAGQIVGSVNSAAYHGFAAGELLLYRVSGQQRSDGNWDVTFAFAVSFNETALTVGAITDIEKDGWDYLWIYYEETHDAQTNRTHKVPTAAYVERVYRRTAYTLLAI